MPFEDLAAFISPGFDLPIQGRSYRVPAPNGRDGVYLQALMDGAATLTLTSSTLGAANTVILSDEKERTVYQLALGPAYDEMLDADVPWPVIKHAGMTAWIRWTRGDAASEKYWVTLGAAPGKAQTADPTSSVTPPEDPSTPPPA